MNFWPFPLESDSEEQRAWVQDVEEQRVAIPTEELRIDEANQAFGSNQSDNHLPIAVRGKSVQICAHILGQRVGAPLKVGSRTSSSQVRNAIYRGMRAAYKAGTPGNSETKVVEEKMCLHPNDFDKQNDDAGARNDRDSSEANSQPPLLDFKKKAAKKYYCADKAQGSAGIDCARLTNPAEGYGSKPHQTYNFENIFEASQAVLVWARASEELSEQDFGDPDTDSEAERLSPHSPRRKVRQKAASRMEYLSRHEKLFEDYSLVGCGGILPSGSLLRTKKSMLAPVQWFLVAVSTQYSVHGMPMVVLKNHADNVDGVDSELECELGFAWSSQPDAPFCAQATKVYKHDYSLAVTDKGLVLKVSKHSSPLLKWTVAQGVSKSLLYRIASAVGCQSKLTGVKQPFQIALSIFFFNLAEREELTKAYAKPASRVRGTKSEKPDGELSDPDEPHDNPVKNSTVFNFMTESWEAEIGGNLTTLERLDFNKDVVQNPEKGKRGPIVLHLDRANPQERSYRVYLYNNRRQCFFKGMVWSYKLKKYVYETFKYCGADNEENAHTVALKWCEETKARVRADDQECHDKKSTVKRGKEVQKPKFKSKAKAKGRPTAKKICGQQSDEQTIIDGESKLRRRFTDIDISLGKITNNLGSSENETCQAGTQSFSGPQCAQVAERENSSNGGGHADAASSVNPAQTTRPEANGGNRPLGHLGDQFGLCVKKR